MISLPNFVGVNYFMNQRLTKDLGECESISSDLAQIARLALNEQSEDVRLYLARLVRRYRSTQPELAAQLEVLLKTQAVRSSTPLRRLSPAPSPSVEPVPMDGGSRLSLLKVVPSNPDMAAPLLADPVQAALDQLIREREQSARLAAAGLSPARSAIFVGKPGVGKTLSAHWLASRLGLPLYVLDLTAVMSSLLGQTGNNLRAALDFAKRSRCVLLLDEIDAVAKRRGDDSDVGELKRLVTVMLQEVESWPAEGLLLAATNHPELIDPALWRRFDLKIDFQMPPPEGIRRAIELFLGQDRLRFERWIDVLVFVLQGQSYSEVQRTIHGLRRRLVLEDSGLQDVMESFIAAKAADDLAHGDRIRLAVSLSRTTRWSQHAISEMTGVSRETIRKQLRQLDEVQP